MISETRRNDFAAILLLILTTTLFFADVLFGDGRFFIRDLSSFYFPTKMIIREVFLSGEFPFWNPYYSAGQPMAANPEYEIFYPLQLLILLPDYDLGFRLHILIHYYIATIGFYVLLRSMSLQMWSALVGSVSLGLGGLFHSFGNLLPILFAAAWMPWIFLFVRRFLLRPNRRDFGAAALLLGLQATVGEPTTLVQTWFLIGTYALYRGWHQRNGSRVRSLLRSVLFAGLMVAAGIAVGAVQLIPAADHVGDSARSRPFSFEVITGWSMLWIRPLELIYPHFFGHVTSANPWIPSYWAGARYPVYSIPFLFSIYFGFLPAAILLCAFLVRQKGAGLVLAISVIALILALGRNTPLYEWIYQSGIPLTFRYPEKFILMAVFTWGIFAAVLFDRLLQGDKHLNKVLLLITLGLFVVTFGVTLLSTSDGFANAFVDFWSLQNRPYTEFIVARAQADWIAATTRVGIAAILAALLYVLRPRHSRTSLRSAWAGLVFIFVTVDLFPIGFDVLPRMNKSFFTEPPAVALIRPHLDGYRIFHEADWYYGAQTARLYLALGRYWIVRNGLFPKLPATWGLETVLERDWDRTHLHPTIDFTAATWKLQSARVKGWREMVMAMSNARFHTGYRALQPEDELLQGRFREAQPIIFIGVQTNPRFYFADQIVTVTDHHEFVEKMSRDTFSRRVAFVHNPTFRPAPGVVRSVRQTANSARLEVNAEGPALLVASITPHKYWRARIDGRPADLQVVNIGYQGIRVPAGRHVVEMSYRNTLVLICLVVSIVSVAAFIVLMVTSRRSAIASIYNSGDDRLAS